MVIEKPNPMRGLIVGNYCHDILFKDNLVVAETLGGAASFISAVLDPFPLISCHVSSKVGPDFLYAPHVSSHPPSLSLSSPTTLFHARFLSSASSERVLTRVRTCDPIAPRDLPGEDCRFGFGMAVGVGGEILPETLERMLDVCDVVFADVQSLIRKFDSPDGTVGLVRLADTGFFHLLPRLGFLKASAEEAPFVDVEEARKHCCVVVTNGKDGCTLFLKGSGECRIPAFPAVEVDPTGAGDCFLGGFAAGLVHGGLSVPDAALLGNFFGSLTVAHIGIPKFDPKLLQQVKDELERRRTQKRSCEYSEIMKQPSFLVGCDYDEQFHASLVATLRQQQQFLNDDEDNDSHYCNHHHKFLVGPVLEESPVQALNTNP